MSRLFEMAEESSKQRTFIHWLRTMSPRYPHIYVQGKGNLEDGKMEIYLSTLVEFMHEGKKYVRHHVEMYLHSEGQDDMAVVMPMMKTACEMTQKFGTPMNVTGYYGAIYDDEVK